MTAPYHQTYIRLRWSNGTPRAPEELRPRLVADATERGTSMTEVIIRVLSEVYGVEVAIPSRKANPNVDGEEFNVRIPQRLYDRIERDRLDRRMRSCVDLILEKLCGYYGLAMPGRETVAA